MTKQNIEKALVKLDWTRRQHIWPNGRRYLWTDAFGVVLLISLHRELAQQNFLDEAEWVIAEVERVLGRERGLRIAEAPDRERPVLSLSCNVDLCAHEAGRDYSEV